MDLINQSVSNLGVSEEQGKGGADVLFRLAQHRLGGDEFAWITGKVSGLDDIVSAAPDAAAGDLRLLSAIRSSVCCRRFDLRSL